MANIQKERGPLQDFLDAVKVAKQTGQQRVEFVYNYPDLFDGKSPMLVEKPKTIDVDYVEVVEPKQLNP
jgi:hypothetical protein